MRTAGAASAWVVSTLRSTPRGWQVLRLSRRHQLQFEKRGLPWTWCAMVPHVADIPAAWSMKWRVMVSRISAITTRAAAVLAVAVAVSYGLVLPASADSDDLLTVGDVQSALNEADVASPTDPLSVTSDGTVSAGQVTISLEGIDGSPAVRDDRQIWEDGVVGTVAQATSTGVQVLSVFSSPEETTATFDFEGADLELNEDGSVTIWPAGQAETHLGEPLGYVHRPWATDASDLPVSTFFTVEGSKLTQAIEPTSATTWPVVADPKVESHWWGRDIRFTKSETRAIAAASSGCAVAATLIPDPTVSKAIAVGCGAISVYANSALSYGKCVALKDPKFGPTIPWIWDC